jgi:hypothetical protein
VLGLVVVSGVTMTGTEDEGDRRIRHLAKIQLLQYQFTLRKKMLTPPTLVQSGPCSKAVHIELHYEPKNDTIAPNGAGGSEIHPK